MFRPLAAALLATVVAACGAQSDLQSAGATGSSSSASGGAAVSCGTVSCTGDQLCFHGWTCGSAACSASCPCTCAALPDACPSDAPCTCPGTETFTGYFGSPGEVFSGADAGASFAGGQVACYGS